VSIFSLNPRLLTLSERIYPVYPEDLKGAASKGLTKVIVIDETSSSWYPLIMKKIKKSYQKEIPKIVNALRAYQPEKIILFGSAARGEEDNLSDIDLLIVKETKRSFLERNIEAHRLIYDSYGFGIPTDVFVLTPTELKRGLLKEEPFILDVLSQGRVIYEK